MANEKSLFLQQQQGQKFILTIDGGGMRGIIPLAMLAHLERHWSTARPIGDIFHLVGGTSTGAVIAAGLALGYSARQLLYQIYYTRLPEAFRRASPGWRMWINYLFRGCTYLYDLKPFYELVAALAQGRTIADLHDRRPAVLFTIKDVRAGETLYVASRGPGYERVKDFPLGGAVAASGAAPIYFPPVGGNLIDGGVSLHGNPSLITAIEAWEYMGEPEGFLPGRVTMLSLGTGYVPDQRPDGAAAKFNLKDWLEYLILGTIDDSALASALTTKRLYGDRMDYRRYNVLLTPEALAELDIETVINPARLSLDTIDLPALELMTRIGMAYAAAVDWAQPNVMPWDTRAGQMRPVDAFADLKWDVK